jgi:hypothetical protein
VAERKLREAAPIPSFTIDQKSATISEIQRAHSRQPRAHGAQTAEIQKRMSGLDRRLERFVSHLVGAIGVSPEPDHPPKEKP